MAAGITGLNAGVTSTPSQLVAVATLVNYGAVLKAAADNAATVYVGFANTVSATTGYPLAAGEEMPIDRVFLATGDLRDIWLFVASGTDSVHYYAA